jgi:hypothetical protein
VAAARDLQRTGCRPLAAYPGRTARRPRCPCSPSCSCSRRRRGLHRSRGRLALCEVRADGHVTRPLSTGPTRCHRWPTSRSAHCRRAQNSLPQRAPRPTGALSAWRCCEAWEYCRSETSVFGTGSACRCIATVHSDAISSVRAARTWKSFD